MNFKRHCGICGHYTEQTYSNKSGKWLCDVCGTKFDDLPGCVIEFTIKGPTQPNERARSRIIYKEQNARNANNINEAITALKRDSYPILYTPAKTAEFKAFAKTVIAQYAPPILLKGAIKLELKFFMQRPQSLPAKVMHHIKKPDHDNLIKTICDAMEGLIYVNDSQIYDDHITKEYGTPRCEVNIEEQLES
jgi:Holliday junction resolvase RusA-like endonuclease